MYLPCGLRIIKTMAEATETASIESPGRLRSAQEAIRENSFAYALVIPTVLYLVLLVWYPFLQGLVMSFFDWPLFGEKTFIGIDNYVYLLTWDIFHQSVFVTMIYATQTFGHMFFGTLMALIVWKQKRLVALTSVIFLIPYIIPSLVTGTLFRFLLHPDVGPFFKIAIDLGIIDQPIYWLTDGNAALATVTLIGVWTWSPLVFLLVISALQGIPEDYYELAKIYGANRWERFRYITFPQIKTTLLIALILRIIWNFGKVSQPFQITRGGPGYSTSVLGILLYRLAWRQHAFGLAFASGILLGLLSMIFIAVFIYQLETEDGEVQL